MKIPTKTCVICGTEFICYGCNPWPVKEHGECCLMCDKLYVTPARARLAGKHISEETARAMIKLEDEARKKFETARSKK